MLQAHSSKPGVISALVVSASLLFGLATTSSASAQKPDINIKLSEAEFVFPQFANPYMEREAGIAEHEQEMAARLRDLLDEGDREAALEELDTLFDLELSPALLHLKAQVFFTLKNYDKAEETFEAVLMRMPQFVRAHSDLGQLYLVTEQHEKARKHFAKAIALGENNPLIHGQLGYLNLKLHNAQSAIAAYQNALALDPDKTQWQRGLLSALSQADLYPAATGLLREMLSANPENADLWLNMAFLQLEQEKDFEALASLETALAMGNEDAENELAAAQLHMELESYERALALLKSYMSKQRVDLAFLSKVSGWLESNDRWQDINELLATYDAKEDVPDSERAEYELLRARTARGMNNHAQAARHYKSAIDADPSNTSALISAADYYTNQERYVEAESLYSRAESFSDTKKPALLGRARIYIELKDYESALNVLRTVQTDYPDTPGISRNVAILEQTIDTRKSEE